MMKLKLPWFAGSLRSAQLFPMVALKVFRAGGTPSGNLLFIGRKTGQPQSDFFANWVCSHATERLPLPLQPFLRAFRKYSKYPLQLGTSDFARSNAAGQASIPIIMPWCMGLRPLHATGRMPSATDPHFLEQLLRIAPGTPLYDMYAIARPEAALLRPPSRGIQRIGRIVAASRPEPSGGPRR